MHHIRVCFVAPETIAKSSQSLVVRGRVTEWLDGDGAWDIVDQLSTKIHRVRPTPSRGTHRSRRRTCAPDRRHPSPAMAVHT